MATLATLVVRLVAQTGEFLKGLDDAGSKIQGFGSNLKSVGGDMTAGISAPLLGAGIAATVMANRFNAGMANVASLVPTASGEILAMSGDVQKLAVAMGKRTDDMTAGLYQVVSAFGAGEDSMAQLEINARAGAAGLATTTDAINLTSAVTKGYGDTSATAMQKVADLALTTVQMGQTTFPELAASIGRVTPLAAQMGMSQEELFAALATGVGVTGNAAEVSTQLRGVLQSLMAPTESMSGLMESLGFASGDAMLQSLGLPGTLKAITQAAETSGQPLQKFIGSIEGQTLAMALAGPQADSLQQKLAAMGNASGATDSAFALQTQGVNASGFAMQQLATQGQVVGEKLGTALAPVLLRVMDAAQPLINTVMRLIDQFMAMDPSTQTTIIAIVGVVAALGPVVMIAGVVASAIGGIVSVLGILMGPIGLVIAAAALLYLAWSTNFLGIRDLVGGVVENLKTLFAGIGAIFSGDFEGGIAKIQEALQGLQQIFDNVKAAIWNKVLEIGTSIVEGIKAGIEAAWGAFVEWAKGKLDGLIKGVLAIFGIHSPSTVFAAMGENLIVGLRVGMAREMAGLQADLQRMATVTANVDLGGGGGQGGRVQITQHFHGAADYAVVRRATEDGIAAAARARGYR